METSIEVASSARTKAASFGTESKQVKNELIGSPQVSIGLPVYNGENFIRAAIESILNQSFQDLELVISDNASTDRTQEICLEYASQDARVRYHRNPVNRGPAWNYNRVFELSSGEYFKWAAHDDVLQPTFIAQTLASLIDDPAAVLSFSQVDVIDEQAALIEPYSVTVDSAHPRTAVRFGEVIDIKHRCYDIFGLIKADVLANTPLIGSYAGSDRTLLGLLSLEGTFKTIPAPLFQARKHAQQSIAMLRQPLHKHLRMHQYAVWFDPKNRGRILLPNWRILSEYISAVGQAPLKLSDRLDCYFTLVRWLFTYQNWAKLGRDIAIALIQIAHWIFTRSVTQAVVLLGKLSKIQWPAIPWKKPAQKHTEKSKQQTLSPLSKQSAESSQTIDSQPLVNSKK